VADLTTNLAGLELENPFILASGPLSYDGAAILRAYRAGAGAIVTKTISLVPATNPIPHIAQVSGGLLNTEKWSDLPYERWIEHEIPYAKEGGATVIGSVGLTPADVAVLARPISDAGRDTDPGEGEQQLAGCCGDRNGLSAERCNGDYGNRLDWPGATN